MIIYCNIILLTDNKLSNGSALLREKVFFLVVLVYNWSNIFFFDAVWNFFRLVISFSIFQRKYGGRKEGKSCRVGRMNVNDELSFAFHSMDQFQFIYMFLPDNEIKRWKKHLFPWEILHTTKIINTKAVYQYKTFICFLIHRYWMYFVFLGKRIRQCDFYYNQCQTDMHYNNIKCQIKHFNENK